MPRKGKLKIGSQNKISFERKSFNTPVCTTVSHRLMTFEEIWTRVKMRAQKTAPRYSALRHHSLAVTERLAHCGFKWVKYAKNQFTWCDFTSLSKQLLADLHHFRFRMAELHIHNLSNRCRHKHDLSISRIMKIYFWRVFTISSSCVAQSSSRNSAVCYIQLFHRRYACVREL